MPDFAVDLHVHSALSPCAGDEMTPNNIVNMALIKGLDFIAITDHNAAWNLPALIECACGTDLVVVPGMEVETREEVHLVCLFPSVAAAFGVQTKVHSALPSALHREDIYGRQLIMDAGDNIVRKEERFLLTAVSFGVEDVFEMVSQAGGVTLPAHADRDSYSILSNLGFLPEIPCLNYIEISRDCDVDSLLSKHPELTGRKLIRSSDAHNLGDIFERESFLELEEKNISCLFRLLKQ